MRVLLAVVLLAGCAARDAGPKLTVPAPAAGEVRAVAEAAGALGEVQPIAVAVTSDAPGVLHLDARQIYAYPAGTDAARTAPLPPVEAARHAGGRSLPGAVKGGAIGAATGGVFGAIGGVISGAILGGIGSAAAAGSAVGAALGAIGGVIGGARAPAADVGGFTDRALPDTALRQGFSATGYLYYPAGDYRTLEVLLARDGGGVERLVVPIAPHP